MSLTCKAKRPPLKQHTAAHHGRDGVVVGQRKFAHVYVCVQLLKVSWALAGAFFEQFDYGRVRAFCPCKVISQPFGKYGGWEDSWIMDCYDDRDIIQRGY